MSLHGRDKSLCRCSCHLTCQHLLVILCTTTDIGLPFCQLPAPSHTLCSSVLLLKHLNYKMIPNVGIEHGLALPLLYSGLYSLSSVQAVPYSREFKQKYDYFRKKLKKPVSSGFKTQICLVFVGFHWGNVCITMPGQS